MTPAAKAARENPMTMERKDWQHCILHHMEGEPPSFQVEYFHRGEPEQEPFSTFREAFLSLGAHGWELVAVQQFPTMDLHGGGGVPTTTIRYYLKRFSIAKG
jgi:hypothetical protein